MINKKDINLFQKIIKLNSKQLHNYMIKILYSYGYKIIYSKKYSYIYALGNENNNIALIAHLDTVFKNLPIEFYYDEKRTTAWSPQGLGADDRAGVLGIIKILEKGFKPTIILTHDEEIGCVGSNQFVTDFPQPKKDLKFLIQLDRRGREDAVFYDCDNPLFTNYITSFGFKEEIGSFSDISFIAPVWGLAAVNLSIGYNNEHSYIETLNFSYFSETIDKVVKILSDKKSTQYEYIPLLYSGRYYFDEYDYSHVTCDKCGKYYDILNVLPVSDGKEVYNYCLDCINSKEIKWCPQCGNAFIGEGELCHFCRKKK